MKPDLIIEYEYRNGRLTAPSGNPFHYVTFNQDGTVQQWLFPEPIPDFAAIAATVQYQNYEANRPTILERERNNQEFETNKVQIAAFEVFVDEINRRRKFERDLLAAVAAATTLANLKSGVAAIVSQNSTVTYPAAKQEVKDKLNA